MKKDWRTPTRSFANGNCVEAASGIRVRDSQDRTGPVLQFTPAAWEEFLSRLRESGIVMDDPTPWKIVKNELLRQIELGVPEPGTFFLVWPNAPL